MVFYLFQVANYLFKEYNDCRLYMKKLLYILLLLLIPVVGLAATYTVSQTGAGADYSAATFNALSGDYSGHTFYFSGTSRHFYYENECGGDWV